MEQLSGVTKAELSNVASALAGSGVMADISPQPKAQEQQKPQDVAGTGMTEIVMPEKSSIPATQAKTEDYKEEYVIKNIESGRFFMLSPQHAENYADLARVPDAPLKSQVRILLDAGDMGSEKSAKVVLVAQDEVAVIVNMAALKHTPQLVSDLVDNQIKHNNLLELTPELTANYAELAQAAKDAGYDKAPRVLLNIATGNINEKPSVHVMEGAEGVPIVAVNTTAHQQTAEFVRERIMMRDDLVKESLASGVMVKAEQAGMKNEVLEYVRANAAKRGLATPGVLVEGDDDPVPLPSARAEVTQTDKQYIIVSASLLQLRPISKKQL
jgi:hypothetical protein